MTLAGVPIAAERELMESWRLRYHDTNESMRIAAGTLAAARADGSGDEAPTVLWSRFMLAIAAVPNGPGPVLDAELDALEDAFARRGDVVGVVMATGTRAVLLSMGGQAAVAWQLLLDDVAPYADALPLPFQFSCAVSFTLVAVGTKDLLSGLRYGYRALDLGRQVDDPAPAALALFNLGYLHINHGSFHEAIERFSEVLAIAQVHDLANRRRVTPPSLIVAHVALGDLDKADALSARWMAEFGDSLMDNHGLYGRAMAIYLAARHPARWDEAEALLATLEADFAARAAGDGLGMVQGYLLHVAWAKARLRRAQGRHAEAVAALQAAEPWDALCEVTYIHTSVRDELQQSLAALGRWPEAHAAALDFARRQANLLSGANAVRLQALTIQHAVERERLARQKAEESARLKSEFLANVSHEIRTPMNAILGMAHLALRTPLAPGAREYVDQIRRAGQTLLGLINGILDFSKIEAGKLEVQVEAFDLDELVGNVAIVTRHDAQEKRLDWSVDVGPGVPRRLRGDALRLGQVLINLVNNAVKFTEPGGCVRLNIAREASDAGDGRAWLCFEVHDTGIGLAPAQLAQLFQPFVQADGSTSRRYGGTGLGLSISRRLAELMGGEITVRSEPGAGSTFFLRVPLVLVPADTAASTEGGEADDAGASHGAPSPPAGGFARAAVDAQAALLERHRGRRVLVVEDNPVNRQIAGELLAAVGLQVELAEDGEQALALLRARPAGHHDLVLMDLQMPRLDGHATTAAIRADVRHAALPIVALTAHAEADVRERCVADGMQDFVAKPIAPEALYRVVDRWLDPAAPVAAAPIRPAPAGAAARRSSPAAARALAEALPGFDVATAVGALGGSVSLYRQVLQRFAQNQAGGVDAIARATAAGDAEGALRAAHTLKGLAGTIGATALRDLAAGHEAALRAAAVREADTAAGHGGDAAPSWPDPAPLREALARVLAAIRFAMA